MGGVKTMRLWHQPRQCFTRHGSGCPGASRQVRYPWPWPVACTFACLPVIPMRPATDHLRPTMKPIPLPCHHQARLSTAGPQVASSVHLARFTASLAGLGAANSKGQSRELGCSPRGVAESLGGGTVPNQPTKSIEAIPRRSLSTSTALPAPTPLPAHV